MVLLRRSSVTVQSAVIATCDRCAERSRPLDPARVDQWAQRHGAQHAREDRRDRCEALGHKITLVTEWMEMDDSRGHAKCSCGWVSKSGKTCWSGDSADKHLADVEANRV